MKKLLEFLIKSIVSHPKEVKIEESSQDGILNYAISAHPDDIKIIIGKKGRTIRSIRELAKIKTIFNKKKINLKIEG
jgi:predicted RNA-binding protein YlqC (UPF0109 family)